MIKIVKPDNVTITLGNVAVHFGLKSNLPVALEVLSEDGKYHNVHVARDFQDLPAIQDRFPIVVHRSPEDIGKKLLSIIGIKITT